MARRYDSTRRQAQARATRLRIIEAATDLFVTQGYAATSIAACTVPRANVAHRTRWLTTSSPTIARWRKSSKSWRRTRIRRDGETSSNTS